jgi:hypothetical protein
MKVILFGATGMVGQAVLRDVCVMRLLIAFARVAGDQNKIVSIRRSLPTQFEPDAAIGTGDKRVA